MSKTIPAFTAMLNMMGSDVHYHVEEGGVACPCLTPEGFRDPAWHLAHPFLPIDPLTYQLGITWMYDGQYNGHIWAIWNNIEAGAKNLGADFGSVVNLTDLGTGYARIDGVNPPTLDPFTGYLTTTLTQYTHQFTPNVPLNGGDAQVTPICNEEGVLPATVRDVLVKASVQPATIGQRGRAAERISQLLGEIQRDDHFGIFPCEWNGTELDFFEFIGIESNYIVYDNRRFFVVGADKIPDVDGDPNHHWELALRLVKSTRPT